jgi:methyl-accepting chemotaxis protein
MAYTSMIHHQTLFSNILTHLSGLKLPLPETLKAKSLVAVGAMCLATVGATLTGNFALGRIKGQVEALTGITVPAMVDSLTVAQSSDHLVRLGPVLAAVEEAGQKALAVEQLHTESTAFGRDLEALKQILPGNTMLGDMEASARALTGSLNELAQSVDRRIELAAQRRQRIDTIQSIGVQFSDQIKPWRAIIESDEEYARSELGRQSAAPERLREAVQKYETASKQLVALRAAITAFGTARDFAAEINVTRDTQRLKFIKINAGLAMQNAEDLAGGLPSKLAGEITEDLERLRKAFLPLVAIRLEEVGILAEADQRIAAGRQIAEQLSAIVNNLVGSSRAELSVTRQHVQDLTAGSQGILAATFVISLIVAGLVAWLLFFRSILYPLEAITGCMKTLATGNSGIDVPHAGSPGEIGAMAQALAVFKDNMAKMEALRAENEAARKGREEERRRSMTQLADTFEGTVSGVAGQVVRATGALDGMASDLSQAVSRTTVAAMGMVETSLAAAGKAQTVASAAEELHASAAEIARQVECSARQTQSMVRDAAGADAMMRDLNDLTGNIGQIVGMIGRIAAQTNLLALNATVEAAHAGDAGKGFAVVATEVKQLASSTASASNEIAERVRSMQVLADKTASAITGIAAAVREIDSVTGAIARSVEEQGSATQEIAVNILSINQSLDEVSAGLERVGADMSENKIVAESLAGSAEMLSAEARRLEQEAQLLDLQFLVRDHGLVVGGLGPCHRQFRLDPKQRCLQRGDIIGWGVAAALHSPMES